jgi:hypothetical protein
MLTFEMPVRDTFYLQGMTVFLGLISPEVGVIRHCDCEIVLNDKVITTVHIVGEGHPRPADPGHRSLGTKDNINLASLGLGSSGFTIRSKAS